MRAILLQEYDEASVGNDLIIKDERAKHISRVVRCKIGDEILLLDGRGVVYFSIISDISKKDIRLKITDKESRSKGLHIDLAIGLPKKEPFELSLKNAVEIGYENIIPFNAEYSQWTIKNKDRVRLLLESATTQSNNPFLPQLCNTAKDIYSLEECFKSYDVVLLSTLQNKENNREFVLDKAKKYLIVIGPEGGLSNAEEKFVLNLDNSYSIKIESPILRTQNAVVALAGFLHGKFAAL